MRAATGAIDVFADPSAACRSLAKRDPALKCALTAIGAPLIRRRTGGFEGLFRIIVEQQVSVPSAQAIWRRIGEGLDRADPHAVMRAGEAGLKSLGLSGPKARYVGALARAAASGEIAFETLGGLADDEAMDALTALLGVGPWTAAIYLLFCEGRADIWPPRDVALLRAFEAACGRSMAQSELDEGAARWTPWRGVAAHILWTYYAHLRGRIPI